MRKGIIFLVLILFWFTEGNAQQDPQYTQYMYNMNVVNPAYAGFRGTLSLGLLNRSQWTGVEGGPRTFTFNASTPINEKVGLGISIVSDEIGPAKEQNIYADFSYTLEVSNTGRLAFGFKTGVTLLDVNLTDLKLPVTPPSGDDLFKENVNEIFLNFGTGIYYYTDNFYVGASIPNILKSEHLDKNTAFSKAAEEVHYYLTSGYVLEMTRDLKFKPSIMLRGVTGTPISIDVSANFLLNDKFELGASYRMDDAISLLFNIGISSSFRIGYAYDFTTSDFSNSDTGGSHEVILLYDIDLSRRSLTRPRFF